MTKRYVQYIQLTHKEWKWNTFLPYQNSLYRISHIYAVEQLKITLGQLNHRFGNRFINEIKQRVHINRRVSIRLCLRYL